MNKSGKHTAKSPKIKDIRPAGLSFERFFTHDGVDPADEIDYTERTAVLHNEKGEVIFRQTGIEAPAFWSDMAVNVVASRYFRGRVDKPDREWSVRKFLLRVVDTITSWGIEQGYFATDKDAAVFHDELFYLVAHQLASFNSPVWFNVGVEPNPQCSACFILSVNDTMESILDWYTREGMIFKGGSGSGVNLSNLRSSREHLSGGGTASGPVSFMRAADASAGVIKSGGKTRRAAKMVILDVSHPDILEFVKSKALEEIKAHCLISAGYSRSFEGEAYATVAYQNANHSVRVSDEFMLADEQNEKWHTRYVLSGEGADTYDARRLLREIAKAAHACGDPGLQFDTEINRMHTSPNTGPIRASNPCSEYLQVDDSACNLASLRLTGFLKNDEFMIDAFKHAVEVMITAQDIIVDKSSYPSKEIAQNSSNMRALGLGYADLGALLMSQGLPYDSDEARTLASSITALLTGHAYLQSAKLAQIRGPFREYERNSDAMLTVIETHSESVDAISADDAPPGLLAAARSAWGEALELGRRFGYSNCQVSVIAPTGTVAFMMDCDTTGIEPEMALVKYKKLAGGGHLKIVNRTVGHALEKLDYSDETISEIVAKMEETGTIENIELLRPEHLPVFDCAFKPVNGVRTIGPHGHLKMMAAVQPFISGGISKTINLANSATVEHIEEIFRKAWKLGLKSISIYRDGCKAVQPLGLEAVESDRMKPVRRRLSVDCESIRHKFAVGGQEGYIHAGFYDDGKLGEIFIRMAKEGSTISGLMDTIATLTSISLQYGVPLEALVGKFSHVRYEPSGFTTNPEIPYAKSLTDYIFRFLGTRFLTKEQQQAAGILDVKDQALLEAARPSVNPHEEHAFNPQSDAPACPDCGAIMVRNGSCYNCLNCGASSGCS